MKSATSAQRPYQEVGAMIRDLIIKDAVQSWRTAATGA